MDKCVMTMLLSGTSEPAVNINGALARGLTET